jgi:hypothetical protein
MLVLAASSQVTLPVLNLQAAEVLPVVLMVLVVGAILAAVQLMADGVYTLGNLIMSSILISSLIFVAFGYSLLAAVFMSLVAYALSVVFARSLFTLKSELHLTLAAIGDHTRTWLVETRNALVHLVEENQWRPATSHTLLL